MCLLSHQLFPKLQSRVYIFHHLWTFQIYILYNKQVLFLLIPILCMIAVYIQLQTKSWIACLILPSHVLYV